MTELATEVSRLSAVDCKADFKLANSSVKGITNGLKSLGILNDQQAQTLQVVEGALSLITGMLGLVTAARAIMEVKRTKEEAEAAVWTSTLVGASILTGGLTAREAGRRIMMATAGSAMVSVALYTAINNIDLGSFNLSTAEGQQSAISAVQGVI